MTTAENNINYGWRYVKFNTPKGVGYLGILFEYKKWEHDGEYRVAYIPGVAFCSPLDQFNKKLARKIAKGRLSATVGWSEPLPTSSSCYVTNKDFNIILSDIMMTCKSVPSWALEAYLRGDFTFGLRKFEEMQPFFLVKEKAKELEVEFDNSPLERVYGKWPGDESDEELAATLREMN